MTKSIILGTTLIALTFPLSIHAQGVPGGAARGAAEGGEAAGPLGAVVGGVVGGVTGGLPAFWASMSDRVSANMSFVSKCRLTRIRSPSQLERSCPRPESAITTFLPNMAARGATTTRS